MTIFVIPPLLLSMPNNMKSILKLESFSKEISDMAREILVSGEAENAGNIRSDLVCVRQRSLKPKDPRPFRKLILRTTLTENERVQRPWHCTFFQIRLFSGLLRDGRLPRSFPSSNTIRARSNTLTLQRYIGYNILTANSLYL